MASLIDPILPFVTPFIRTLGRAWAWGRLGPDRGEVTVKGLSRPVTIHQDEAGVPHIYAETTEDLFFAQGWVHARDRLFQMDLFRRTACGELAEIIGDKPVSWTDFSIRFKEKGVPDLDWFFRTIGIRRAAATAFEAHSKEARAVLEAYAAGVSRYITDAAMPFPIECSVLGYHPRPWEPQDSLAVSKLMAFRLCFGWKQILTLWALRHRFAGAEEMLASLSPRRHPDREPRIARYRGAPPAGAAPAGASEEAAAFVTFLQRFTGWGVGEGSNAFVAGGKLTASGKPILASDPHLDLSAPCMLYPNHLVGGGYRMIGASVPGTPGIICGHNGKVAWGITLAHAHDCDYYREEVDPKDPDRYRVGDGWDRMDRRPVVIEVREEASRERVVRSTRHGPVISDVLEASRPERGEVLAFRWIGQEATTEVDSLLAVSRAEDARSFIAATESFGSPSLSMVFADTAGHFGYTLAGRLWKRDAPASPILPRKGWEEAPRHEFVPFAELPRVLDPEDGVVVSANNDPVAGDYPHYISRFFEPPYRARRIRALLLQEGKKPKEKAPLTPDAVAAMLLDQQNGLAPGLLGVLLKPFDDETKAAALSPDARKALNILSNWASPKSIVGQATAAADSTGAAVFHVFLDRLMRRVFEPRLGETLYLAWVENWDQETFPMEAILSDPASPWWEPLGLEAQVRLAIEAATLFLREKLGPDPAQWKWGRLARTTLRHAFHPIPGLGGVFDIGPYAKGGDSTTVDRAYVPRQCPFDVCGGPAYRQVIDLADVVKGSRWVIAGGVSGNPASPHYADQAAKWAAGDLYPMRFDDAEVRHLRALVLEPPDDMDAGHDGHAQGH